MKLTFLPFSLRLARAAVTEAQLKRQLNTCRRTAYEEVSQRLLGSVAAGGTAAATEAGEASAAVPHVHRPPLAPEEGDEGTPARSFSVARASPPLKLLASSYGRRSWRRQRMSSAASEVAAAASSTSASGLAAAAADLRATTRFAAAALAPKMHAAQRAPYALADQLRSRFFSSSSSSSSSLGSSADSGSGAYAQRGAAGPVVLSAPGLPRNAAGWGVFGALRRGGR
jgi:hypothetical protein